MSALICQSCHNGIYYWKDGSDPGDENGNAPMQCNKCGHITTMREFCATACRGDAKRLDYWDFISGAVCAIACDGLGHGWYVRGADLFYALSGGALDEYLRVKILDRTPEDIKLYAPLGLIERPKGVPRG